MKKVILWCKQGTSDKVYILEIVKVGKGYHVNSAYGRRGSALRQQSKSPNAIDLATATSIYESVLKEKFGKGYTIVEIEDLVNADFVSTATAVTPPAKTKADTGLKPQLLNPISIEESSKYLNDPNWCLQEKMDGKHVIVRYLAKEHKVIAANKKGEEIGIPLSVVNSVKKLANKKGITLDGELIGEYFHVFDILECEGLDLRAKLDFSERYSILEHFIPDKFGNLVMVKAWFKTVQKKASFEKLKQTGKEGAVFKNIHSLFSVGRPSSGGPMLKCKFTDTLSVIVDSKVTGKSSFASFVYRSDGSKMPLGNCTVPVGKEIPKAGTVVEIRYLYVIRGGHLYQPVYLGVRDDVGPEECTESQIKYKNEAVKKEEVKEVEEDDFWSRFTGI